MQKFLEKMSPHFHRYLKRLNIDIQDLDYEYWINIWTALKCALSQQLEIIAAKSFLNFTVSILLDSIDLFPY
jgi:hypothetical protein